MRPSALARRLDDFLNPIVVKELRQAVRSRVVMGVLILFLVVQLAVVWLYLVFNPASVGSLTGGRDLTAILYVILFLSCMVFVPLYTGVRLAVERSAVQMDLMFTTTISPGAIVRGKMLSGIVLTALIYSACAPFMTFTYLLRGIDLPTVFLLLGCGLVYVFGAIQLSIFVACIPASRLAKVLLGLGAFGIIVFLGVTAIAPLTALFFFGGLFPGGSATWEVWAGLATGLLGVLGGMGLLYFLSVAILSPPSANRMFPVRLYLTAWWGLSGVLAFLWLWAGGATDAFVPWTVVWASLFAVGFVVAVSERQSWGPRVRRRIPKSLVPRAMAFFFFSGSAGGVLWAGFMAALTLTVLRVVATFGPPPLPGHRFEEVLQISRGIVLFGLAYALTASLIRQLLLSGRLRLPHQYTWVVVLALVAVASVLPLMVLLLVAYGTESGVVGALERGGWTLPNPMFLADSDTRQGQLIFVALWAGCVALASLPWLVRQVLRFRPLRTEARTASDAVTDE